MKKLLIFFLVMMFTIINNTTLLYATPPLPSSAAEETTFTGIIPLTENNLEIISHKYLIDFDSTNLATKKNIERQAKVTMTYEIFNNDDSQKINFTLPILSNFLYFLNEFKVKVNNNLIESTLSFSECLNKDYCYNYYWGSISEQFINFDLESYHDFAIRNYQFENDFDGYLYTLVNPETRTKDYNTQTQIIFHDVPSDNIFVDKPGVRMYSSNEVAYFFATSDLEAECISTEWKSSRGISQSTGNPIKQAKLDKEPYKLKDYIKRFYLNNDNLAYGSAFESLFYQNVDKIINHDAVNNDIFLKSIMERAYNDYLIFGLEFSIDFEARAKTQIEISYEIPIFCQYGYRYNVSHMVLDFVSNPGKLWNNSPLTEILIKTDELINESSLAYVREGNEYKLQLKNDSVIESVTLSNSLYERSNPFGCFSCMSFWSIKYYLSIGLIMMAFFLIRRNQQK